VEEFKALAAETRAFLGTVAEGGRATRAQLLEIVMAQDFQDLTGQVIKKVVALAQQLETDLIQVLIEAMPQDKRAGKLADRHAGLMNGPVVAAEARDDVVTGQAQVDDLLESLGF
jgi:chemotaxis protein CheZ